MERVAVLSLASVIFILGAVPGFGQKRPLPWLQDGLRREREAMSKLDFMIGKWEGECWTEIDPLHRRNSHQTVTVDSKLGGLLVTLEEVHRFETGKGNEGIVVETTFVAVSFNEPEKKYRFQAFSDRGGYVEAEAKVIEGILEWSFAISDTVTPGGMAAGGSPPWKDPARVRHTIKFTKAGQWLEVSELTINNGKSWQKCSERTLKRVSNSASP